MTKWHQEQGRWSLHHDDGDYDVDLQICTDPDCDAHEATVVLREGEAAVGRFELDLDTGALRDEPAGPEWVAEAAAAIPTDLRQRWARFQGQERYLARITLPKRRITAGTHVMYSSLLSPEPSVFDKGGAVADLVELLGERWAFDESFCPNPGCDCREGALHATRADGGSDVGFNAPFQLGRAPAVAELYGGLSPQRAEELLAAYREARPSLVDDLVRHHDQVKAMGRRSLAGHKLKLTRKPSRNGPCPCGSGKRYKACCGR